MGTLNPTEVIATTRQFQRIGSVAELQGGSVPISAVVDGKEIAVFAVDDDIIATSALCPHANGPLHEGEIEGRVLTCPWHGWGFNLDSGVCEDDPCMTLERYEVRIEGDDILVGV